MQIKYDFFIIFIGIGFPLLIFSPFVTTTVNDYVNCTDDRDQDTCEIVKKTINITEKIVTTALELSIELLAILLYLVMIIVGFLFIILDLIGILDADNFFRDALQFVKDFKNILRDLLL